METDLELAMRVHAEQVLCVRVCIGGPVCLNVCVRALGLCMKLGVCKCMRVLVCERVRASASVNVVVA